jgi:hypothetical protein
MKKENPFISFLLKYGWAIMSALITIIVLIYFFFFSMPKVDYPCLAEMFCQSQKLGLNYSSYNIITLKINCQSLNNLCNTAKFDKINFTQLEEKYAFECKK